MNGTASNPKTERRSGWRGALALALCSFLSGGAGKLHAVEPYAPVLTDPLLDAWRWQKLPEFDGKEPRAMVEARDGAMWFGVGNGVLRYDGIEWRSFGVEEGLAATNITTLRRNVDGAIFAGTDAGIYRFDGDNWERVFPRGDTKPMPILALVCGADGSIWASYSNSLLRLKAGQGTLFVPATSVAAEQQAHADLTVIGVPPQVPFTQAVQSLFEDRDGMIWCGVRSGDLVRFNPAEPKAAKAWRVFAAADGFHKSRVDYAMCQTRDGRIWFGGDQADVGLNCYDPAGDSWTYVDLAPLLGTDNLVRSILETSDGTLWVGGLAKLFRLRDGQWKVYRAPEAPISSSRISMLESRSGDLWLLGSGDDVQRIDYQGRRWRKHEGLNFQCETPDGRQWFVAADDGVVCFDGARWWRYGQADGLMTSPFALLCTRRGELWAAGSHQGVVTIARLDGDRWTRVHEQRDGFAMMIDARAVAETPDGSLWFGAYVNGGGVGILQYDPAKGGPTDAQAWVVHKGTGYTTSFGFAVADDGALFSAAYTGLARYDGHAWERVDRKSIDAVAQTHHGKIWVGTRGTGVYQYGAKPAVTYTMKDGLIANGITALFFDRDDHLWVGTSKGISFFDGTEWITDAFPEERLAFAREGGGFRQTNDGSMWFNQSSREWMRRALLDGRLPDGTLQRFWTVRYRREMEPPRTVILTALERVSQPGNTAFTWRGVDPWWRSASSELRYSYRIDDGPWSRFGPETNHVFLELPIGRHVFEVRARDRDLNVEKTPARAEFTVLPPVWREPWFVGLMGLLCTAIGAQSYRVLRRGQGLRASNQRLSDEIAERRAIQVELEQKKASLETEIDERKRMEREVERIHKQLMQASHQAGMAEVATSVLHNIGNVLNSINVSATMAEEQFKQLKVSGLTKAATLLEASLAKAESPPPNDKVRLLPEFFRGLAEQWSGLQANGSKELGWLRQNIEHVKEIVAMQQDFARFSGVIEKAKVSELVEDAIRMNTEALARHRVTIVRDYRTDAMVELEKNKVLQILVNLVRNAKQACTESSAVEKQVVISICPGAQGRIQVRVKDNGVGISPENLSRLFTHGFTTRKSGHGFGLHSSANAARALGATLTAHSEGTGQGATFTLDLAALANTSPPVEAQPIV